MFPNIKSQHNKKDGVLKGIVLGFIITIAITSCKKEIEVTEIDFETTPVQVVKNMHMMQSRNGGITMQMISPTMERYQFVKDSLLQSYEIYPDSFFVYGYTKDGALETTIVAQAAKHITTLQAEEWIAYGNVEVNNIIQHQKLYSDTIYWDQENHKIHTNCYVRLQSGDDVMQGYGMESDEMARNATILSPFDSYSVIKDSISRANTPLSSLDSLNLMGPFPKK